MLRHSRGKATMTKNVVEFEICTECKPESFRTTNGWWFVAICESCGTVVSSISCGGDAVRKLHALHINRPDVEDT